MRKTFLKVALIGLLVGSLPVGFTSCKDYDDDIEQTNNQVADLKTKLASVETAIAALPSKADVTAAQAAAVAQAKADLEAVKAELQKAIDGKADKEAVEAINTDLSKIKGQLETIEAFNVKVTESMDALNGAIEKINEDALKQGQMIAGLEAEIAELKKDGASKFADLAEELAALKNAVNDPTNGLEALKNQIAELAEKIQGAGGPVASLEAALKVLNGMITHIEVVNNPYEAFDANLNLFSVTVKNDLVFGKDMPGEKTFKAGEELILNDSLLVRVSPVNAVVTPEQISLVNSLGEDLSDYIKVTEVKSYDRLLQGRAVGTNGLFVVKFELKADCDKKAYKEATITPKENFVDFAVAIKDQKQEDLGGRLVTSAYAVNVLSEAGKNNMALNYKVDETWVNSIRNRFTEAEDGSSIEYAQNQVSAVPAPMEEAYNKANRINSYTTYGFWPLGDYAWKQNADDSYKVVFDARYSYTNAAVGFVYNGSDNRSDKDNYALYPITLGESFTVDLSSLRSINTPTRNYKNFYGFYVALDKLRATESNGSELIAWESYEANIEGLNKVVTTDKLELTVTSATKAPAGEVIGFRVWAVNYDGTLVDPDGKAFYVVVGQELEDATDIAATIVAPKMESAPQALELGDWVNTTSAIQVKYVFSKNIAQGGKNLPYASNTYVILGQKKDNNGNIVDNGIKLSNGNSSTIYRNATDGYSKLLSNIIISIDGYKFADNTPYYGQLIITDATNSNIVLQTINLSMVKTIYEGELTGVYANPKLLNDQDIIQLYVTQLDTKFYMASMFVDDDNHNINVSNYGYRTAFQFPNNPETYYPNWHYNYVNQSYPEAWVDKVDYFDIYSFWGYNTTNSNWGWNANSNALINKLVCNGNSYDFGVRNNFPGLVLSYKLNDYETGLVSQDPIYYSKNFKVEYTTYASKFKFAWKTGYKVEMQWQWDTNATGATEVIEAKNIVISQDVTTAPGYTNLTLASVLAGFGDSEKVTHVQVELTGGIAAYYDIEWNDADATITLTQKDEVKPAANVDGNIVITYKDQLNLPKAYTGISQTLPVSMKK